jgi:hypothetical protein
MSITWAALKVGIARKLKDPSYRKYEEGLLMDAANDALVAFASSHTGAASTFGITGDGETYEFDLPSDIIEDEGTGLHAVHWKDNQWLEEVEYFPGMEWASTTRSTTSSPVAYILWPQGKISFSRVPVSGQVVTLYYVAYYPRIEDDDTVITIPRWAEEPIKLYSAASAIEPASVKTGNLRQYGTRRDSGDPEDNPLLRLAEHYMQRYYRILADHPVPQFNKFSNPGGRA